MTNVGLFAAGREWSRFGRFRFDDRDGTGSYYCNQCGPGTGLLMIRKLKDWDHKTACDAVDKIIGSGDANPSQKPGAMIVMTDLPISNGCCARPAIPMSSALISDAAASASPRRCSRAIGAAHISIAIERSSGRSRRSLCQVLGPMARCRASSGSTPPPISIRTKRPCRPSTRSAALLCTRSIPQMSSASPRASRPHWPHSSSSESDKLRPKFAFLGSAAPVGALEMLQRGAL
jgi:hypothetical protein